MFHGDIVKQINIYSDRHALDAAAERGGERERERAAADSVYMFHQRTEEKSEGRWQQLVNGVMAVLVLNSYKPFCQEQLARRPKSVAAFL